MLVDYDLDVEAALELAKKQYEDAPTKSIEALIQIYYAMALYYNSQYSEAIKMFNQVDLNKVNIVYHALIFAFTGYSAFELDDRETLDLCVQRLGELTSRVNRKYVNFVIGYQEVLNAIKNLEVDPETYFEVIQRNFSREDGYVSTKLIYNYRLAHYYRVTNNTEEMDICLAKVIANGKNHHTAVAAKKLFKNTVNVEDYVFPEPGSEPQEVEVVEEPMQIETLEEVEVVEEVNEEVMENNVENVDDYSTKSVVELKELCREKGLTGYSKLKKDELIELLKNAE
jgi:tetratricopeptide (TPR) repeat protein